MPTIATEPHWLRAGVSAAAAGVDRQAEVIRGMVLAQEGPFKTAGRGEFDLQALRQIVSLAKKAPGGLKSRFAHPTLSEDGLGKFLGRVKAPRLDTVRVERDGQRVELAAVRGDLHLDPSAHNTPSGDLAGYVLDLAANDPDALSSSLVLQADLEYRLHKDGTAQTGPDGEPLPPLWRPTRLHASDVVDTGDAVDGLLSARLDAEGLPDAAVRQGAALLDRVFSGQAPEVVACRCLAWLAKYLDGRGDAGGVPAVLERVRRDLATVEVGPVVTPRLDERRLRLDEAALTLRRFPR